MGASQYASSFGRLQSIAINFLSEEFLLNLLKANSVTEMVKQLESTWYGEEIKKAASVYKEAELLEVAFNRNMVETNKMISATKNSVLKDIKDLKFWFDVATDENFKKSEMVEGGDIRMLQEYTWLFLLGGTFS